MILSNLVQYFPTYFNFDLNIQTMERKPSALSVHDRLYSNKSDNTSRKNFTTKLKQVITCLRLISADAYKLSCL